jgi:queuine tRNA-ribosyltransferase
MTFELVATSGAARRGRLTTPHGAVETPAFMPVGTQGAVKSLTPADLREVGAEIVLANTYHLFLRPGHELVLELGGLHRFMGWGGPILTDSGGYQVWSLAALRTISEEGVRFRSHLDGGAAHLLTPELAVEVQLALGADILHPLDECLPYPATRAEAEASMQRTLRWARRARTAHGASARPGQACFGIVQGGMHPDLRRAAVEATCAIGFDGYALGGFAVGEPHGLMVDLVAVTAEALPWAQPRYLMGVGRPPDLVEAVAAGVDLFDCVLPTRHARTGQAFTRQGVLVIRNAAHARDPRPLDPDCPCYACRSFSRAYLRHLFLARELTVYRLLTLHNLTFYLGLMAEARAAITSGALGALRRDARRRGGHRAGGRSAGAGGVTVTHLVYAMASPPPGGGGPGSILIQMAPIILVLGIFFFLVIRPQQRERKRREEMLSSLKKGDRVVTTGGLIGTIVGVSEQTLILKIADSVRVECLRSAVTGLRGDAKAEQPSA